MLESEASVPRSRPRRTDAKTPAEGTRALDAPTHRRILGFLNGAVHLEDLVFEKVAIAGEGDLHEDGDGGRPERRKLLERELARSVLELRNREFPLGSGT